MRLSSNVRYTSNFTPPTAPYLLDSSTTLLMHLNSTSGVPMAERVFNLQNVTLPGIFDEQATHYAVCDFLERDCGVSWFNPTATGSFYPSTSTLVVSGDDVQRSPSMDMRYGTASVSYQYDAGVQTLWAYGSDEYNTYAAAAHPGESNAQISRDVQLFLGRMRYGGEDKTCGHSLYDWYDRFGPESGDYHPEYFAQGRTLNESTQLDYSNPDVIAQVAQDAADYYDTYGSDARPFNIVPMDNTFFCLGQDCTTGDYAWSANSSGFFSDSGASNYIFHFVNQVVAALHDPNLHPGHQNDKVSMLAYSQYAAVPTNVSLDPSVEVQFCFAENRMVYDELAYDHELGYLDAWRAEAANSGRTIGLWLYPWVPLGVASNFNCFPGSYAHALGTQFDLFTAGGYSEAFCCGWGQEVEAYITLKLMDDPTQDVDTLLNDYFSEMYGTGTYNGHTTAYYMQQFYNLVEDTYCDPANYPPEVSSEPEPHHQTETYAWHWLGTADVMAQLQEYMDAAITAAGTGNVYATNVELFRLGTWNYMLAGRETYLAHCYPTVSITDVLQESDITITAIASDSDGVSTVEFYADSTLVGTDSNAADGWSCVWSNPELGEHNLTAVATDTLGYKTTSSEVPITVTGVPRLTVVEDQVVDEGQLLSLTNLGVFTDLDSTEGFTYSIDWGDGTPISNGEATVDSIGSGNQPTWGSFDSVTQTTTMTTDIGTDYWVTNTNHSRVGAGFTDGDWVTYYAGTGTDQVQWMNIASQLSGIPSGSTVSSAVLTFPEAVLYSHDSFADYSIFPIPAGSTTKGRAEVAAVTSPVYYASHTHYGLVTKSQIDAVGAVSFDITDLVQGWLDGTLTTNVGQLMIVGNGVSFDWCFWGSTVLEEGAPGTIAITTTGAPAAGTPTTGHIYADNGSYTVTAKVFDEYGASDTETFNVTVNNIAPYLAVSGAGTIPRDTTYTLNLSSSDPGADTINHWDIDWGDGNQQEVTGNPSTVTHVYTTAATRAITATATDEDGTYSTGGTAGALDTTFGVGGKTNTNIASGASHAEMMAIQADDKMIVVGNADYGWSERGIRMARYLTDGSLDSSFGNGGLVALENVVENCAAVAIQPDGRIVVAGSVDGDISVARFLADGQLDSTFGTGGVATTDLGGGATGYAYGITVQSDSKIVVVGSTSTNNGDFLVIRYNADGTLDTSFDTDGKVSTDFSGAANEAYAVVMQSDGKIVVAGWSGSNMALARYNTDGSLDTGFDTDGKVTTDFGGYNDFAWRVAIQSDGKIVAAGGADNGGSNGYFALARYNTDGSLDTGFGTGGKVTTDFSAGWDAICGLAIRSDGKLVVGGYAGNGTNNDFAVVRYNADGSLDTSFDTDGKATTDFGNDETATDVAILSDGKTVAAGFANSGARPDFAVARYNADGSLDTSFSTDGKTTTAFGGGSDTGESVAVQSDGKVVVGATTYSMGSTQLDFAVVRYNADGSLDTSFGTGGKAVVDFEGYDDTVTRVAIQSNGKILVAGSAVDSATGDEQFALARYNTNGTLDTGFGTGGKVTTTFTGYYGGVTGIAIQSDGKIVVSGYGYEDGAGGNDVFTLARFNSNGSLDTSFDTDGRVTTTFTAGDASALDVTLQSNGKIVVSGKAGGDMAVARYNTDGSLDTSFDSDGKLNTDFGAGAAYARSVTVQSDGKIVVAGFNMNAYYAFDFALARYNSDGSLDTSFDSDGKLTTDFGDDDDEAYDVAIQSDGEVVVVGKSNDNVAVARYNTDGSLDTSFDTDGKVTTDLEGSDDARGLSLLPDGRILVVGTMGTDDVDVALLRYQSGAIGQTVVVT